MDINSLDRFIEAQKYTYSTALKEIKDGEKRTHWMWYIFPQIRGLGMSPMAHAYGIADLDEAKEYLAHPILSARLIEICEALLTQSNNANHVFGDIDAMKLRSSMTLFALISERDSVFHKVLQRFYKGRPDEMTLEIVGKNTWEL